MSNTFQKKLSRFGLVSSVILGACLLSMPAGAQGVPELPDFGNQENSNLPDAPGSPEADVFGLGGNETFDFEKTPQQLEEEIRNQAFEAALQGLLPLRPEEIRILLERYDRTQESVETPIYPPPKPLSVVETLAMDPGSAPTTIKTALGHITTVNFIDITGKPWPVEGVSWAGDFDVMETAVEEDKGVNILRITPRNDFARGNMSIKMVGLATPIIIVLATDKDEVHYRFDATVPQNGPLAEIPLIDHGITLTAGRADISGLLQGIIPTSAGKLNVTGVDGRTSAYTYNGLTYLRTPLTLLSPGWSSSVASADGMRVYEIPNTPVVLLSDKGKMTRAQISDREELLDE